MKTYNYTFYNNNLNKLIDYDLLKNEKSILVQIFCGHDANTLQLLTNTICNNLPQAICVGTTTDGEICEEKITTLKTIISISVFENTFLKASLLEEDNSFEMGYKMAKSIVEDNTKLIITFTDGTGTNAEEYLKGIEKFDNTIMVCGGMAGDNGLFKKTYISLGNKIISKGYVAVSLNSDILKVKNARKFDWVPIGLEHTIDKVEGNRIYEISGMTPQAFYKKYLGDSVTQTEFPLIVERNGIPTARAVLEQHEDGSLSCGGNLIQGDKVRLGFGDAQAIMSNSLSSFKNTVFDYQIETFFLYSCMARRRYMRDLIKLETQPFSSIAPTAGFFTYAEFFHKNGHNELLNQTLTIVALAEPKERITSQKIIPKNNTNKDASFAKTLKSLTHLIQKSTADYQEQTKRLNKEKEYSHNLLAAQKQFLRHTVHETNTPLSVIMGNIELYEMEFGKNKYLSNIEVAMKNLFSIYDDLSYLVKKDQIEYTNQDIDLVDYIRSRIDFFSQVAIKAKSRLLFQARKTPKIININETKLQRIIDNNITNAIKYSFENEDIFINLIEYDEFFELQFSSHSSLIQEPKKVFEEYYREEKLKEGYGLGLNLVKKICDEEGIKIELESNEKLTTFTYYFTKDKNENPTT